MDHGMNIHTMITTYNTAVTEPASGIQQNFSGSNTDGSFTTALSNSLLSP